MESKPESDAIKRSFGFSLGLSQCYEGDKSQTEIVQRGCSEKDEWLVELQQFFQVFWR